ncbi:swr complex subunit [Lunasporangiospora selenospora]|uniref:SWR1-complex protein 4 n=1 Tax=Lunasporangiospora selenospora TaxID=979761 RepID=A0A9P6G076_9FUNG|nr:swr complex subunit [Lunasporangiospora selenospora]
MATGNDVREIFQLKPSEQIRRVRTVEKKPGNRELYGLIGNNVSTVAFNNPTYKPKLNLSTKAVNWTWRPFVNPSRDDDLVLHHWEKARTDPNEEYRFYRFNKVINLNEFTTEEYQDHLQDPDWSLEETCYLWDLCRRFDLRWVVIQDRYEWPPQEADLMNLRYHAQAAITGEKSSLPYIVPKIEDAPTTIGAAQSESSSQSTTNGQSAAAATSSMALVKSTPAKIRSMEDLKHRYYSINRMLIKIRMTDSSQAVDKAQLLSSMAYDKNREVERKKNLGILNPRKPEEIEEEEALYLEARRIDQNEKKITRERENLLRLLSTRDIYGPGGPASAGVPGAGGPGSGIIIPSSNSITIPSSGPASASAANGPLSPSSAKGSGANGPTGSASASTPTSTQASASGSTAVKKRKKAPKGSNQAAVDEVASTSSGTGATGPTSSSQTKGSNSNNRRPSNASSTDLSTSAAPAVAPPPVKKEKLTPGAYLRSQKQTPIVSTKVQRVQSMLMQLGVTLKPMMPTASVMAKWDQLNTNIVTLLDLKKQVDKLESDLKVAKMRRGSASGVGLLPVNAGAPSSGGGGSGGGGSGSSSSSSAAAGSGGGGGGGGGGGSSSAGGDSAGNFGVKREGAADELGTPGQIKKKKRKE